MQRIKLIENHQGNGGTRVQEDTWQRILRLDNGYFEKDGSIYDFYTSDGLLIRATKNSDDFMASRFIKAKNELFVDYCEPGLGYSIVEENITNRNQFLFRDTGFYNAFGNSFYIKFEVSESIDSDSVPSIWSFQTSCNGTKLEIIRHFLFHSIFCKPLHGQIYFKMNEGSDDVTVIFKVDYYRKLLTQMQDIFKQGSFGRDTSWYNIYFGLKSAKPIKDYDTFNILTE